jgi:uncharacterized RDD family membrane protein YckC
MTAPSVRDVARARLLALWADLRGAVTLRRREKRFTTYALRLLCLFLLLVVLPLKKLTQLGLLGSILALGKVALAVGLMVALLAAWFAFDEWSRRRRRETAR